MIKHLLAVILLNVLSVAVLAQSGIEDVQHIRPAWSPSGDFFAYLSNETGRYQLYVSRIDPLKPKQLSRDTTESVTQFKWSPGGNKLLFQSGENLRIVSSDGSGLIDI